MVEAASTWPCLYGGKASACGTAALAGRQSMDGTVDRCRETEARKSSTSISHGTMGATGPRPDRQIQPTAPRSSVRLGGHPYVAMFISVSTISPSRHSAMQARSRSQRRDTDTDTTGSMDAALPGSKKKIELLRDGTTGLFRASGPRTVRSPFGIVSYSHTINVAGSLRS